MMTAVRDAGSYNVLYARHTHGIGELAVRPLMPESDAPVVHSWVTSDRARFWGMQGYDVKQVESAYREIVGAPHSMAYMGLHYGDPAFLLELYDPAADAVGKCYDVRPGDQGLHVLVAPPERRIPGFTWGIFTLAMDFAFCDSSVERVVVEPDVRNDPIHELNERAGFQYHRQIELPDKIAWLATCTRDQYRSARQLGD